MSKININQLAKEFEDATVFTFKNQHNATPVIFYYDGKFDFSSGSIIGGMSELVYNNVVDIVIQTEQLKEIVNELTKKQRVGFIEQQLENYLEAMSKIKIHHTAGNISYYYTEKMKEDGLVFIEETYDKNEFEMGSKLDLVDVKKDNAIIYQLYDNDFTQTIEIYMMVKLVAEQYGTDDFYDFVEDVSFGSMGSAMQSNEESKKQIYEWLFEMFNEFLEEIEWREGIK